MGLITNELGSTYDAENAAIQAARQAQLDAYNQALMGEPAPTQDEEDTLTATDTQSGATYRIPLSQLSTQNERFEVSTLPASTTGFTTDDWVTQSASSIRFDKSQFTGYRSIVFRSWLKQYNPEVTATVYLRLVDVDDVPVAGSELEHTGTVADPDGPDMSVAYESGDLSDVLLDASTKYSISGKVSDVEAHMSFYEAALVVRFGPEIAQTEEPLPDPTPNGNAPGPTLGGASHFWDFSAYGAAGTGLLNDTGTEGTLPLTQPVGYDPTEGPFGGLITGVVNQFRNLVGPYPPFGTDDFTLLWVGTYATIDDSFGWFNAAVSNGVYTSGVVTGSVTSARFGACYGDDCSEEVSILDTATVGGTPGDLDYAAVTRQGTQLTVTTSVASTTITIPIDTDLTGTGLPPIIGGVSGTYASHNGVAVWVGIALTPEQIEAAAAELGWS